MRKQMRGFSLIETVVLVALVGVLIPPLIRMVDDVETEEERAYRKAREGVMIIDSAMGGWSVDLEKPLPSTEQGLQAFVDAGYFGSVPKDPWGREYRYAKPGRFEPVDIWSQGPDGVDSDDDVVSWNLFGPASRYGE